MRPYKTTNIWSKIDFREFYEKAIEIQEKICYNNYLLIVQGRGQVLLYITPREHDYE